MAQDRSELDVHITKGLAQKNLNKLSNKFIEKSFKENDDGLLSMNRRFHYLYRQNVSHIDNLGFLKEYNSPEYIKSDIALTEKIIVFFLTNLLELSFYDAINHKTFHLGENIILKEAREAIDVEKILTYLKNSNHEYASYLKIQYLLSYYTEHNITDEQYFELKQEILSTIRKAIKFDQMQFISRIIQLICTKLAIHSRKYYNEVVEFAKLISELKIYPDEKMPAFSAGFLRDIFIIATSIGEDEWVEKFVEEYAGYLNKDLKTNSINYFRAVLNFKKKKYEESLDALSKIKIVDIIEKLDLRFYHMMNYIELKAYESAIAVNNSIRQLLHESKDIPDSFKDRVDVSLKYFNEIIKYESKGAKMDGYIFEEAKNEKRFSHIKYVLAKMESLV